MVVEVLVLVAHHTNNYYSKQKHLKRLSTKIPKYCFQLFVRASMPAPTLISQAYTVFSNLDNVMQSLRFRCFLNSNFFHNSICYCVSKSHHAWPYPTPPPQNHIPFFSEFVFHAHLLVGLHIVDTYILKIFPQNIKQNIKGRTDDSTNFIT